MTCVITFDYFASSSLHVVALLLLQAYLMTSGLLVSSAGRSPSGVQTCSCHIGANWP